MEPGFRNLVFRTPRTGYHILFYDIEIPGFSALSGLRNLNHGDRDCFLNPGSTVYVIKCLIHFPLLSPDSSPPKYSSRLKIPNQSREITFRWGDSSGEGVEFRRVEPKFWKFYAHALKMMFNVSSLFMMLIVY